MSGLITRYAPTQPTRFFNESVDHVDVNEDTLAEYDTDGKLVAVTVEHAKENSVLDKSILRMVA